jgi:hypothetical protein
LWPRKTRPASDLRRRGPNGGKLKKGTIVLFRWHGQQAAPLFKTNVWHTRPSTRPPAEDKRPQISYYDDGVGTPSPPLAAPGGAFGWG